MTSASATPEKIIVVGLPDAAVKESQERVRAAVRNSGARVPLGRITVNLAPADLRKEGPAYDLPIALGMLLAGRQLVADLNDAIVVGELSLDGSVRHTTGILPMVALAAWKRACAGRSCRSTTPTRRR